MLLGLRVVTRPSQLHVTTKRHKIIFAYFSLDAHGLRKLGGSERQFTPSARATFLAQAQTSTSACKTLYATFDLTNRFSALPPHTALRDLAKPTTPDRSVSNFRRANMRHPGRYGRGDFYHVDILKLMHGSMGPYPARNWD
jgi:hypothetical protein